MRKKWCAMSIEKKGKYTCNEFRQEMILVNLRIKLEKADLSDKERRRLQEDIAQLEEEMGLEGS
jgi:hypothetical protein